MSAAIASADTKRRQPMTTLGRSPARNMAQEHDPPSYYPYLDLTGGRSADSVLDVPPPVNVESSSGEMRVVGTATHDKRQEIFEVSLRGRSVRRSFGGDDTIDFGSITLSQSIPALPPALNFSATSLDRVRELDVGSSLEERWQGVGSIAFGIMRENYRRTITIPGIEPATDRLMPWRINSRFTVVATRDLLFYGSYTQGLEDSAIAPSNAINRGEPPAASRTWQVDGGLAPPAWGPWAAGMALNWLSSRPETLDDQMSLPSLTTLDANIRRRWK